MAAWWPGDYDQQELSDHSHCQTCYNWKNCDRLEKQLYSCAIVDCPNECPFRFHSCKLEEHLSLCPSTICRCLNVEYGCPQSLPRWKLADHLRICPASVVVCPLVWNRQKGPMEGDLKFLRTAGTGTLVKACGQGELDVAFARKDQLAIQSGFSYPRAIRRRIKGGADYILPSLPFVTNWQKVGSQWASGLMGEEVAAEDNYSSEEEDKPVEPPVSRDCIICRTDPSRYAHFFYCSFLSMSY